MAVLQWVCPGPLAHTLGLDPKGSDDLQGQAFSQRARSPWEQGCTCSEDAAPEALSRTLQPRSLTVDSRRHRHPHPRPGAPPISQLRTSECQDRSPCSWQVLWLHRWVLAPWASSPLGQCRSSWIGLMGAWRGCGPRAFWGLLGPVCCSPCFSAFFEGLQAQGEGPTSRAPISHTRPPRPGPPSLAAQDQCWASIPLRFHCVRGSSWKLLGQKDRGACPRGHVWSLNARRAVSPGPLQAGPGVVPGRKAPLFFFLN